MIFLHIKNRTVRINGASEKLLKRLDVLTSYLIEGHRFAPKFRAKKWDGKEHLLKYYARRDPSGYYFPTGLIFDVVAALDGSREEYRLVDLRQHLTPRQKFGWNLKVVMRPYQLEAVEAMTTGHMPGVGILKMPPRSGKTITTARIIHGLQATTLIIVPSRWLLGQTAKSMEAVLQIPVGRIGDGMWSYGVVTVATIETLLAHRGGLREREVEGRLIREKIPQDPGYTALLTKFDLVVFDECIGLGSKVAMGNGTEKNIEQVQKDDYVYTPLGPRRVLKAKRQGVREVILVHTDRGVLFCTPDHPLACQGGNDVVWKEAKDSDGGTGHLFYLRKADHQLEQGGPQNQLRAEGSSTTSGFPSQQQKEPRSEKAFYRCSEEGKRERASCLREGEAGRKREPANPNGGGCIQGDSRSGIRTSGQNPDGRKSPERSATKLRDRPFESGEKDRGGDRWERSSCAEEARGRCEKDQVVRGAWLPRFEGPGSPSSRSEYLGSAIQSSCDVARVLKIESITTQIPVYDLEVEEAGCFFADGFLVHNCHHLRGKEWHKVFNDFESYYRIGLSATAFPDNDREQAKGGIWMKACCGKVRFDVSPTRLIHEGFLMRPIIEMHRIQAPNMEDRPWDSELLKDGIYENCYRNERIADIANRLVRQQSLKILIVTNRKEQARRLAKLLEARGLLQECVFGDTPTETRGRLVEKLVKGFLDVLIGTVFGEGVDIPEVECVINAEGGRDIKATFQRMRNLTVAQGKTTAVFVDFLDMIHPYLALHSLDRLRVYRSEPAFVIRTI